MSITGHTQGADTTVEPAAVTRTLRDASFANLLVRADGPSLAATALLARTCDTIGLPYQVSPVRTRRAAADRRAAMATDTSVIVVGMADTEPEGRADVDVDAWLATNAVTTAVAVADHLDAAVPPTLALAGIVAAGEPASAHPSLVERAGLERHPGVAIPVADPIDGLAHSTLVHGPFSGDPEATAETVAGIDGETRSEAQRRRLASLVAVAVTGAEEATPRAATAVEALCRPYPIDGPVATLGGYADVLEATAATAPGIGVALALDGDMCSRALDRWRSHANRTHAAIRSASTARYDGLLVVRIAATDPPASVETVARLMRDFRSPEPAVLAVGGDQAAVATTETPASAVLPDAAAAVGGSALCRENRGFATIDPDQTEAFITTLREGL